MHTPLNLTKRRCKPQETFILLKPQQTGKTEKIIPELPIVFQILKLAVSPHLQHEPYGFWDCKKMKFCFSVKHTALVILIPLYGFHESNSPPDDVTCISLLPFPGSGSFSSQAAFETRSEGSCITWASERESVRCAVVPPGRARHTELAQGSCLRGMGWAQSPWNCSCPQEQHLILPALGPGREALGKRDQFWIGTT